MRGVLQIAGVIALATVVLSQPALAGDEPFQLRLADRPIPVFEPLEPVSQPVEPGTFGLSPIAFSRSYNWNEETPAGRLSQNFGLYRIKLGDDPVSIEYEMHSGVVAEDEGFPESGEFELDSLSGGASTSVVLKESARTETRFTTRQEAMLRPDILASNISTQSIGQTLAATPASKLGARIETQRREEFDSRVFVKRLFRASLDQKVAPTITLSGGQTLSREQEELRPESTRYVPAIDAELQWRAQKASTVAVGIATVEASTPFLTLDENKDTVYARLEHKLTSAAAVHLKASYESTDQLQNGEPRPEAGADRMELLAGTTFTVRDQFGAGVAIRYLIPDVAPNAVNDDQALTLSLSLGGKF